MGPGHSPSPWTPCGRRGKSHPSSCTCPGQTCGRTQEGVRRAWEDRGRAPRPWAQGGRAPGAHGHFVGVMDVGALLAAVAPAEAVVVHAVLLLPLPLLPGLPDDGQAALHGPAAGAEGAREPEPSREPPWPPRLGTYLARERLQLLGGSTRPAGRERPVALWGRPFIPGSPPGRVTLGSHTAEQKAAQVPPVARPAAPIQGQHGGWALQGWRTPEKTCTAWGQESTAHPCCPLPAILRSHSGGLSQCQAPRLM